MYAISWGLLWTFGVLCFVGYLLSGCAPLHLQQAKERVDARMTYVEYETPNLKKLDCAVFDKTYTKLQTLAENEGNCTDFAYEYQKEIGGGFVMVERLPDGRGHAYLWVDGYRVDVLRSWVVKADKEGCE